MLKLVKKTLLLTAALVSLTWIPGTITADDNVPYVTGVSVSSSPLSDSTYKLGEEIEVTVGFSENVTVAGDGTPTIAIDMSPLAWGTKQAAYESGSGTNELTFTHTVTEPNYSTDGIAVLANSLALNGATIQSSSGTDVSLNHPGLGHDSAHKVNWLLPRPDVTGISITSSPASGDTYRSGEKIEFTVTFDEAVNVSGTPSLTIDMNLDEDWGEKTATYKSGAGTSSLVFEYEVAEPNISDNGVAVVANSISGGGGHHVRGQWQRR